MCSAAEILPPLDEVMQGKDLYDAVEAADLAAKLGQDAKTIEPVLLRGMQGDQSLTVIKDLDQKNRPDDIAYLPVLLLGAKSSAPAVEARSLFLLGNPVYASAAVSNLIRGAVKPTVGGVTDVTADEIQALVYGGEQRDQTGVILGSADGSADQTIALILTLTQYRWSADVRCLAFEQLGKAKVSTPDAIAALVRGLHDDDRYAREQAAQSFYWLGKQAEAAKPVLLEVHNQGEAIVKSKGNAALAALGALGDDESYYQWVTEVLWNLGMQVDMP